MESVVNMVLHLEEIYYKLRNGLGAVELMSDTLGTDTPEGRTAYFTADYLNDQLAELKQTYDDLYEAVRGNPQ